MACGGVTKKVQKRLNAYSASPAQEWFTEWLPAIGLDDVMFVLKARASTSAFFEGQVIMQTAKIRTDDPDTPTTLGSSQATSSNGGFSYNPGVQDVSSNTAGVMFVRYGVAYKYTSGQAQASADVGLEVSYKQCGDLVGAATHQLSTSTSDDQYVAVTSWLPGLLVSEVKAALIVTSLTGNFQCRLAYRTAATSQESPSAWNVVTDSNAPYTGGEHCTGDLPVTVGNNMWIQFGLMYESTSGAGQATVAVVFGTRRD